MQNYPKNLQIIDTLWGNSTTRTYAKFTGGSLIAHEEIQGRELPIHQKDVCHKIYRKCEDIFSRLMKIHPEVLLG
jgi:hypothetical protein